MFSVVARFDVMFSVVVMFTYHRGFSRRVLFGAKSLKTK